MTRPSIIITQEDPVRNGNYADFCAEKSLRTGQNVITAGRPFLKRQQTAPNLVRLTAHERAIRKNTSRSLSLSWETGLHVLRTSGIYYNKFLCDFARFFSCEIENFCVLFLGRLPFHRHHTKQPNDRIPLDTLAHTQYTEHRKRARNQQTVMSSYNHYVK